MYWNCSGDMVKARWRNEKRLCEWAWTLLSFWHWRIRGGRQTLVGTVSRTKEERNEWDKTHEIFEHIRGFNVTIVTSANTQYETLPRFYHFFFPYFGISNDWRWFRSFESKVDLFQQVSKPPFYSAQVQGSSALAIIFLLRALFSTEEIPLWMYPSRVDAGSEASVNQPPYTRKIGLPESRVLYTVLRSPHIDKKSREQFEMEIKKKYLVIKT